MANEIIKYPDPAKDMNGFLTAFINVGLNNQQASYVLLCERKNAIFNTLQTKELEAQQTLIILKPESKIEEIEETLKKYRAIFTEMAENIRKPFSNYLRDNLIQPSMEFETRVNPENNEDYKKWNLILIEKKRQDQSRIAELARKSDEKTKYLAHIKNENTNRVAEYKQKCIKEINTMYDMWIEAKIENPDINTLKQAIGEIRVRNANIMNRQYLSDQEASDSYVAWLTAGEVYQVDQTELTQEMLQLVDVKFTTYANDLTAFKNRPEVLTELKQAGVAELNKVEEQRKTTESVNNLVSTATIPTTFKSSYKPLKESFEIEMENSREFAVKVMSVFIQNPQLDKYLKVRDWKNLKIEQMCSAIAEYASDDNGKKFPEFKYNPKIL